MSKTVLLALALVLLIPAPASAQQGSAGRNIEVTGLIEKPEVTTYQYGTHATTDEASGKRYALMSEEKRLLDRYVGERATVYGTTVPGFEDGAVEGGPPLVRVERAEPASDSASGERVRVEISLVIEGEAPEDVSFYVESSAGGEVICTTDADVIAQAGYPECRSGANEVEIPAPEGEPFDYRILKSQGAALSQETVSEGSETASDSLVIEATYSFDREERATPVPGGGDKDLNADGVVNTADGQLAAEVSDAARITAASSGQPVLPVTGGPPLLPLALLLAAGLLAHRLVR